MSVSPANILVSEISEASRRGTAPAAVDEEGRGTQMYFSHLDIFFKRGIASSEVESGIQKACENCGAITHSTKICLERPRRIQKSRRRLNRKNIGADDYLQFDMSTVYNGKRGRLFEGCQRIETVKRQKRAEELNAEADERDFNHDESKYGNDTTEYVKNLGPNFTYHDILFQAIRDSEVDSKEESGKWDMQKHATDPLFRLDQIKFHAEYSRNEKLIGSRAERIIRSVYEEDAIPDYLLWPYSIQSPSPEIESEE